MKTNHRATGAFVLSALMQPSRFRLGSLVRLCLSAVLAFVGNPATHAANAQRPNILFIFSEDHARQAISA